MSEKQLKKQKRQNTSALIVCNGQTPPKAFIQYFWDNVNYRVAADGGANALYEYDMVANAVVGDFDSLHQEIQDKLPSSILYRVSEQNTNDADKAVQHCLTRGYAELHLVGADGTRQDQFLSNLEILLKYSSQARLILWTELERMEIVRNSWKDDIPINTTVSLLPLFGGAKGVVTKGLQFALKADDLLPGKIPSGVSNKVISNPVKIKIESGQVLLIVQHNKLNLNFFSNQSK